MNFNIDEKVKETVKKQIYTVGIHKNNRIAKVEYDAEYDCLDIYYENPATNMSYKDRIFNPTKNVPDWTTPEKELLKVQSRIKHVMRRFMTEEESKFEASSWKEMCEKVADLIMAHSDGVNFDLKFIYNKSFEYPELGLPRFIKVEGEAELEYSKWEKTNRMLPEVEVESTPENSEIF